MIRLLLLGALLSGLFAGPTLAQQQSYKIMLGGRQLGTLTFDTTAGTSRLLSTMDNTPLGVADGTFEGVSQASGNQIAYQARSRGSRVRDIAFSRQANTVTSVSVTPASEMTDLTNTAKVPAGVISPTEAFAALVNQRTCPSPMTIYDGRRVVQIGTTAMSQQDATVNCDLAYGVLLGPGHLSPFRFKSIDFKIAYTAGELARIVISAGGFSVNLIRD
jgi:hypothetical protein